MYRQFCFKPATFPFTKMTLKDEVCTFQAGYFCFFLKIAWLPAKIKDAIVK